MPQYLVTYDLEDDSPSPYGEFLVAAKAEGLLYVYKAGAELNRLPNTTLWGNFADKDAVRAAFERALLAAKRKLGYEIVLQKRVITAIRDAYFRSDVRKAPERRWTGSSDFETCRLHQENDPFFNP